MNNQYIHREIRESREQWEREIVTPALKAHRERNEEFYTSSGIGKKRVYTPEDLANSDYNKEQSFPGAYPYTRGIHPTMYRGRFWTMRQYSGFGSAEESNQRYRYLLDQGQTGLSIAFDLPTQMGYDSDDPMSNGEVGKAGVAVDSIEDMETLFRDIPLDKISTSMTINAPACIVLAMYIALGDKQGVSRDKLFGTIQNDVLKEYIARGTYIFPPVPSMRLITDVFQFCTEHLPRWNTISISGYHIREAGSTAAQEIGFTLSNGITYVRAALDKGLDVDTFAPRLSFFFNAHNDLFEEVAKFRAVRRMWAKIMKDRFHAQNPASLKLRFHTQTGGSTLTAQQPHNNIVRVAVQALAAVLGGTQSLHTNAMDEALALPTAGSAQIALRTQQVLAYESGTAEVVDPLGGSYYIESLTDDLEAAATEYIEKIESMGGMIKAIESGYVQREIQRAAYKYQLAVENREQIVVGLNDFRQDEPPPENLLKIDLSVQKRQIKKLKELKKKRNNKEVETHLRNLAGVSAGAQNIMPHLIAAVSAYATIGEISNTLRSVFGEYKDSFTL
ncbi:methylmalonyl-CoA mutase [candidate division KSB1 bacterium]